MFIVSKAIIEGRLLFPTRRWLEYCHLNNLSLGINSEGAFEFLLFSVCFSGEARKDHEITLKIVRILPLGLRAPQKIAWGHLGVEEDDENRQSKCQH